MSDRHAGIGKGLVGMELAAKLVDYRVDLNGVDVARVPYFRPMAMSEPLPAPMISTCLNCPEPKISYGAR